LAEAFAEHKGDLSFKGLENISEEVATAFARHQDAGWGELDLNPMDKAVVIGMRRFEPGLFELELLNVQIAQNFLKWPNIVNLRRFTSINDAAAQALAGHEGRLFLDGLAELSVEIATALSAHEGSLWLTGLTELSANTAMALSKHKGPLVLDGLFELSVEIATVLSTHKGPLSLGGLTEISDEVAQALSKHYGPLRLTGLTSLSDTAAEALSKLDGEVELPSFEDEEADDEGE